jgi:hypothetical protein
MKGQIASSAPQGIEKPFGFFDAKGKILRAPAILADFRAAH